MTDKYEDDIHNVTNARLAEMLEPLGLGLGAEGYLKACEIIGEAVRRLRIPPHPTFHEEYMGECL